MKSPKWFNKMIQKCSRNLMKNKHRTTKMTTKWANKTNANSSIWSPLRIYRHKKIFHPTVKNSSSKIKIKDHNLKLWVRKNQRCFRRLMKFLKMMRLYCNPKESLLSDRKIANRFGKEEKIMKKKYGICGKNHQMRGAKVRSDQG